jgi:prepilin-type N-terminal cleavage/methylation domain-containing protein
MKKNGFSLVELLVVVTIMLVLTGIGIYSINKFNQMSETTEMKDYLSTRLKLARNLSITNQLPDKTTNLKYVKITILNDQLTVEAIRNDGTGTTESPYFLDVLNKKSYNSISLTNNSVVVNSFGFLAKSGKLTNSEGNLSNGPVIIRISSGSGDYNLTINDLGIIQ